MRSVKLTPWELAFLQGKVATEYLTYVGHKANGLKFTKEEDVKLAALKTLDEKLERADEGERLRGSL